MPEKTKITVARGDGIGPEIMDATLHILEKAGAAIEPEFVEIGETVYKSGFSAGMKPEAWHSLRRTKVFLKAPITTPQGGGYKSLNVTIRTTMGLFANVRPVRSLYPFVSTKHQHLDMIIIRENEEDLYTGIEYQQTPEVVESLKLISRPGSEKIIRYAFEYAKAYGRKKVTCMVKDNIMKQTDGLFHRVFDEIAQEYPDIENQTQIIDIGSALLADRPQMYEVVVTLNLYGDIISDIVAQIAGSVGLAGSANIGEHLGMFEAVHGSAPDIAGKNMANPSGLLNAAVMMLVHIGQAEVAEKVNNAWLKTIEDGIHTGDIFKPEVSKQKVGTKEFAEAVVERLGKKPSKLVAAQFADARRIKLPEYTRKDSKKQLVGVDVYLDWPGKDYNSLGTKLIELAGKDFKLEMITNRGVKVFPDGHPETFCTDHWRCRFVSSDTASAADARIYASMERSKVLEIQKRVSEAGYEIIKTENLYLFDDKRGFSPAQGA